MENHIQILIKTIILSIMVSSNCLEDDNCVAAVTLSDCLDDGTYFRVMIEAAQNGQNEIIGIILDKAESKIPTTFLLDIQFPMIKAAKYGNFDIVKKISEFLTTHNKHPHYDDLAFEAARGGYDEIVDWTLKSIPDNFENVLKNQSQDLKVEAIRSCYEYAIRGAAEGEYLGLFQRLISEVDKISNYETILTHAAKGGNIEIIKLILTKDFTPNYDKALLAAAEQGRDNVICWLLIQKGVTADVNKIMIAAAKNGHKGIVARMLSLGVTSFYPAKVAAQDSGYLEIVNLIECGNRIYEELWKANVEKDFGKIIKMPDFWEHLSWRAIYSESSTMKSEKLAEIFAKPNY